MAGVNFEKYKSKQEVKSKFNHCDKEKRKKQNHQNEHIDTTKTHLNLQARNYSDTVKRFEERQNWLEQQPNRNKRGDKVICVGLEIPLPADLPTGKEAEYMNKIVDIIGKQYGKQNIMNVYLHVDEVHEYIDSRTKSKTMSRKHIHCYVTPEIDGRLNCRDFSSRNNMIKLNNAIHEMTLNDYGVKFMDGSKRKSKDSVEALKRSSERLELEAEVKALKSERNALKDEIRALEACKQELTKEELTEPYRGFRKRFEGSKQSGDSIANTLKETKTKLQRVAEQERSERLAKRNADIYSVFSSVLQPEDYVEAEEQSDEDYT